MALKQLDIHKKWNPMHQWSDIKCKTIKLEDIIVKNLDDFEYGDDFLDTTPTPSMKEIIGILTSLKLTASIL